MDIPTHQPIMLRGSSTQHAGLTTLGAAHAALGILLLCSACSTSERTASESETIGDVSQKAISSEDCLLGTTDGKVGICHATGIPSAPYTHIRVSTKACIAGHSQHVGDFVSDDPQCIQCTPTTCAQAGANCGTIADGCGGELTCGSCAAPATCGGAGTANVCGCTPTTCAQAGANCGTIADGCGGELTCGNCAAPATCGGAGTANVCGCTPTTCAQAGANCGTIADGCGGELTCGNCAAPATCGGAGTANVCGDLTWHCAGPFTSVDWTMRYGTSTIGPNGYLELTGLSLAVLAGAALRCPFEVEWDAKFPATYASYHMVGVTDFDSNPPYTATFNTRWEIPNALLIPPGDYRVSSGSVFDNTYKLVCHADGTVDYFYGGALVRTLPQQLAPSGNYSFFMKVYDQPGEVRRVCIR